MRFTIILLICILCFSIRAGVFSVVKSDGKPVNSQDVKVEFKWRNDPNGVRSCIYKLTSLKDKMQKVIIRCRIDLPGRNIAVFNGAGQGSSKLTRSKVPQLCYAFPMVAAWQGKNGKAVALGIEDNHSFADADIVREKEKLTVTENVYAALMRKGSIYSGKFHVIPFNGKYGERDAFARYYQLYPHRFKRNPTVNPRVYGFSAQYSCWRTSNAEACRLTCSDWDWGIDAIRHWGDVLNDDYDLPQKGAYRPKGFYYTPRHSGKPKYYNFSRKMPKKIFENMQKLRVENAYFCDVINCWYLSIFSRVHPDIGARHPDSLGKTSEKSGRIGDYIGVPYIFTFPETSWGKESRRLIKELLARYDLGALAFDIPLPQEIYRGTRMPEMNNVGFDKYGPGVIRGKANNKLCDYIHSITQKSGEYKTGIAINSVRKYVPTGAYVDCAMVENNPWAFDPPWPLLERYSLGEKTLTFWEGYQLRDFDPEIKKWPPKERDILIEDLSRFTAHRCFLYGIAYTAYFFNGYLHRLAPALKACMAAGWKPVPGMITGDKKVTLTRYGKFNKSFIALCNLEKQNKEVEIELFPEEFNSDAMTGKNKQVPVFAGFFGGKIANIQNNGKVFIKAPVSGMRVNVLESVGKFITSGNGKVVTFWQGGVSAAKLTLSSVDFKGKVELNRSFGSYTLHGGSELYLTPGKKVTVTYANRDLHIEDKNLAAFPVMDRNMKPCFRVLHSADISSRDTAERVKAFCTGYGKFMDKKYKLRNLKLEKKPLPPFTVVLTSDGKYTVPEVSGISGNRSNIVLRGRDRLELQRLMTLLLNIINDLQFPHYMTGKAMDKSDAEFFNRIRY